MTKGLVHEASNEGETNVWLTPRFVLAALGPFDLDPCAAPEPRPWPTAAKHITEPQDGLAVEWSGRVWCNPPYGPHTSTWLERLAIHGRGTALIFARTETETWQRHIFPKAHAILFLSPRVKFHRPDGILPKSGGPGAPSALIAYGADDAEQLRTSGLTGAFLALRASPETPATGDNNA